MRLTLRTLLAYIDDVLPPAQAKEIGSQIGAIPEAAMLMQKLRDVIHRRRLLAPNLSGPGSGPDPNIVGEYLESSLPPAAVVELEQLCYRSDMHMAEVAACHKILTLVLGEPVEVSQDVKERMYSLGQSGKPPAPAPPSADPAKAPVLVSANGAASAADESAAAPMKVQEPLFEEGIPDYLKRPHNPGRWFTTLLVLCIAAVWLVLTFPELKTWWHGGPAPTDLAATDIEPGSVPENSAETPTADATPEPATPAVPEPAHSTPGPDTALASSTPAPAEMKPPVPMPEPQPDPIIIPAPPNPNPPMTETVVEPAVPLVPAVYLAHDDVLISRPVDSPDWTLVPSPSELAVDRYYAIPIPYSVTANIGEGKLNATFQGETLFERLPLKAGETLALGVDRGHFSLSRKSDEELPRVRLIVGERAYLLELTEPETAVGIEVILPPGQGPAGPALPLEGGLQVTAGSCRVITPLNADGIVLTPVSGRLSWGQAEPNAAVPLFPWLANTAPPTTIALRNAREFEKEFQPDSTVSDSISPVVDDRLETKSVFAAQTMALIDNLPGLARGLDSEHEGTRIVCAEALRRWLPRDPDNAEVLREELSRTFREQDIPVLIRLLWGYSAADAKNPEISKEIVALMGHEEVAVREIAFLHASQLSNRKYDYRAMLLPNQRAAAILRWQQHLQRFGALAE